ncbi:MAG: ester cyclase [Anaerolineales bacterium]|nr:ester cyclase [Anaerolineales bacterium]
MVSNVQANFADKIWRGEITPDAAHKPASGKPLTINEMKDAIVRLFDEANKQNFDIFDEMLSEDFVSYGGAGFQDLHGPEAFKQLYIQFIQGLPDLRFRVDRVIAEGNLCAVRGTLSGTHSGNFMGFAPPTGNHVVWTGTAIMRFNNNGLIDARWQEWDGLSVMQQMGVVPASPNGNGHVSEPIPPHVAGGYSSPSQNKAAVRRFIEEFWNQGEMEVADEIFHPQATSPSEPQLPPGPAGFKAVASMVRGAMPDYHIDEIKELLADGDQALAWFIQSGTQTGELMGIPPSGKKAAWGEILILRFAGGKVVESWHNVDMLGLFQQLGVGGTPSAGA